MATGKPLTDLALRALKPRETPYKLGAGFGLHVLVEPTGTRLWRFAYRFDGKQKVLALGRYPDLSLVGAREARDAARDQVEKGIDPSQVRKAERAVRRQNENTFEVVARAWLKAKEPTLVASYSSRIRSRLEDDVFPEIGQLSIDAVEPPALLAAIRKIEDRGAIELAKRVKNYCSEVFQFAIAEGKAVRDPAADIRKALRKNPAKKGRAALAGRDLPEFLDKLEQYDGETLTRLAVKLVLLTFVRTQEARFARWEEMENLEGSAPTWRIPGERMKMRRDHIVPLSRQSVAVLREIRLMGLNPVLILPADTRSGSLSENTMLYALYRMGYHGRATIHGFRGTASTTLNESGRFNKDWIELQLAHVDKDAVRGAYNAAEHLAERRVMMQWWADHLDALASVGALI